MIVVEEFLKDYVKKQNGSDKLMVFAKLFDADYHVGEAISYDFEVYNERGEPIQVFHWLFDPLSARNPVVMENSSLRRTGREALSDGNLPPAPHRDVRSTQGPELEDIIVAKLRSRDPRRSPPGSPQSARRCRTVA
jgi:hypothetical protein